jgi:hypothetical protein
LGFFDAQGHICINALTGQPELSVGQKAHSVLYQIKCLYSGYIIYDKSRDGWVWGVGAAAELDTVSEYLFSQRLQIPIKQSRLRTFRRYLFYRARKDATDIVAMPALVARFNKKGE